MAESDVRCKARAVRSMHEKGPPTNGAGTQRLRVTTRSTQQASEGCATPGAFFVLPPSAPRCATSARAKEVQGGSTRKKFHAQETSQRPARSAGAIF